MLNDQGLEALTNSERLTVDKHRLIRQHLTRQVIRIYRHLRSVNTITIGTGRAKMRLVRE